MKTKLMPTTYLLVAILLSIALHYLMPIMDVIHTPWNLFGLVLVVFGIWINISADQAFKRSKTTVKPFDESSVLVQDGVFRFSRNPMYLGFTSILLGVSILLTSLSPYIIAIVFAVSMDFIYIRIEERMLGDEFGDEWAKYRSRVRKWI